jgi:hypothetical protein
VTVTNVGDQSGSFDVTLEIGTAVTQTQPTSTLASGATKTVTFSAVTGDLSEGTYTVNATTADDTVTGTLTVEQPATPSLSALDIAGQGTNATVAVNDSENVAVEVTNTGDQRGAFNVTLDIETSVTETRTIDTLDAGATETVTFENVTRGLAPGAYDVAVTTGGETAAGTLTVVRPPTANITTLDVAGQGDDAVVPKRDAASVAATVTNTGDLEGTFVVTLDIVAGNASRFNATRTVTVSAGATERVVFENVTGTLPVDVDGYGVVVTAADAKATGTVAVSVDVNGNGAPARDTTGDGLLNDVRGDGRFDIFDVQTLFANLDRPAIDNNARLFSFQEGDSDEVTIFDVQALFVGV